MATTAAKFNPAKELALSTFEGAKLLEYLTAVNRVPESGYAYLPPGVGGEHYPFQGLIKISPEFPVANQKRTAVHELTHAADSAMFSQSKRAGPQFKDAYAKLNYKGKTASSASVYQATELAKLLSAEWAAANKQYRATGDEITAFGVGNHSSALPVNNPAPAHLDATAATEFMILLDLAMRDLAKRNKDKK